jgi:hypothetical protein
LRKPYSPSHHRLRKPDPKSITDLRIFPLAAAVQNLVR